VSTSEPAKPAPDSGALAVHFEWTERLFAWTRRSESFQFDELTFVLIELAIGLAWFSARR
jgi:hypothetical protein